MKLARLVIPVILVGLTLSPAAWSQGTCETFESTIATLSDSPGSYIGNSVGDIAGAVGLTTISRIKGDNGETLFVMSLKFVERGNRSSFSALLTAFDEPTGRPGSTFRHAEGEITAGTGRFAAAEGRVTLDGVVSPSEFNATLVVDICRR